MANKAEDITSVNFSGEIIRQLDGDLSLCGTARIKCGRDNEVVRVLAIDNIRANKIDISEYLENLFESMIGQSPSAKNFGS